MSRTDRALAALWVLGAFAVAPFLADAWKFPKELVLLLGVAGFAAAGGLARVVRLGAGLFALSVLVASARSALPVESLRNGAVLLAWFGLVAIVAGREEGASPQGLIRAVRWTAIAQVAIGSVQLLTHGFRKLSFIGTLGNSDYLGAFLGGALILNGLDARRPWERNLGWAVCALGVLLARSRGVWLALAIVGAVYAVRAASARWPRRRVLTVAALSVVLATGAILAAATAAPDNALTSSHTLRGRWLICNVAAHELPGSLGLGIGFGDFRLRFVDGQRRLFESGQWSGYWANASQVRRVHHEPLDLLLEGGVLALAAFASALFAAFRADRSSPFAYGTLFFLLHGLVSFPLHVVPTLMLSALCVGGQLRGARPASPRLRPLWAVLLLVLVVSESLWLATQWFHQRAVLALRRGDAAAAVFEAERALRFLPLDYEAQVTLARARYRAGDLEGAAELLSAVNAVGPTIDALKLQGMVLRELHRNREAISVWRRVAGSFPLHVTPHYELGRLFLAEGCRDRAREELKAALERRAVSDKGEGEQRIARQLLAGLEEVRSGDPPRCAEL